MVPWCPGAVGFMRNKSPKTPAVILKNQLAYAGAGKITPLLL